MILCDYRRSVLEWFIANPNQRGCDYIAAVKPVKSTQQVYVALHWLVRGDWLKVENMRYSYTGKPLDWKGPFRWKP